MTSNNDEHFLERPHGRTVAYAHAGNLVSSEVVLFFHGVFGVGDASRLPPILEEKDVHYIAPTLPGWGKSSPPPHSQPFHQCLYEDVAALVTHLHPQSERLRLYIAGGSYGTVAAQMLYGASYDHFPLGQRIVGLLLLAPFSPPRIHKGFAQCLSWQNYVALGPPSRVIPFNLTQRMGILLFRSKVDSPQHAAEFIHQFGFQKLDPSERQAYEKWKETRGLEEGEAEKGIGQSVHHSVATTWEGFLKVPSVVNSDWGGYDPRSIHSDRKVPVLVVMNNGDRDHKLMGEWLVRNMKDCTARYDAGGHMASMFFMDEIWAEFMSLIP